LGFKRVQTNALVKELHEGQKGHVNLENSQLTRNPKVNSSLALVLSLVPLIGVAQPVISPVAGVSAATSLAVDSTGNLYSANATDGRIRRIAVGAITSTVVAGGGESLADNVAPLLARLRPIAIAFDAAGNLFIAEEGRIRKWNLSSGLISTVAGNDQPGFSGDGRPATQAQVRAPLAMGWDAFGQLYFADSGNRRVRRVRSDGLIFTLAGNGQDDYVGSIGTPTGLAVAPSGDVFIASPNRFQVLRLDPTGTLTPYAGNGAGGVNGDGGSATLARLCSPGSLALDEAENLLIADASENCSAQRLRRVDRQTGVIQTLAGGGSVSPLVSGPALSAKLGGATALSVGPGTVYIVDNGTPLRITQLTLPAQPPHILDVVNAASFSNLISPGMLITLFGNYLGPVGPLGLELDSSGKVKNELGGVRVFLNDVPAPLIYVSPAQINAVAPFSTNTATITVRVERVTGESTFTASFTPSSVGIFPGAIVNPDGSINSQDNPAPRGSIVLVYGTGMGDLFPRPEDGSVAAPPLSQPSLAPRGNVSNLFADVLYMGPAPNFVNGVMQANVKIPDLVPQGPATLYLDAGQGGSTHTLHVGTREASGPTPVITDALQLNGQFALTGPKSFTLHGTDLLRDLTYDLFYNDVRIATRGRVGSFSDETQLNIQLDFGGNPGNYAIEIRNPGGRRSARIPFVVAPVPAAGDPSPVPVMISLAGPTNPILATGTAQTLEVMASGMQTGFRVELFLDGVLATNTDAQISNVTSNSFQLSINFNRRAGLYGIELVNPSGVRGNRLGFNVVEVPNQAPAISSMSPASPTASTAPYPVVLTGTNFVAGSTVDVFLNGNKTTTIQNPVVPNPATMMLNLLLAQAGNYGLEVVTQAGLRSARFSFVVQPTPSLTISSVTPTVIAASPFSQAMTIIGGVFVPGLVVEVFRNGVRTQIIGTANVTQSQFTLNISFPESGPYDLEVVLPDARRSNRYTVNVQATLTPTLTSVTPSSFITLPNGYVTLTGTNFVAPTGVELKGANNYSATLPTQFLSSTSLNLSVRLGSDLPRWGQYTLQAINPGGTRSSTIPLTWVSTPAITGTNPASIFAIAGAQTVTIVGGSFVPGLTADLFWDNTKIASHVVSTLTLQGGGAPFSYNFGGAPGNYAVEITNPEGGKSNRFPFTVAAVSAAPIVTGINPSTPLDLGGRQPITIVGSGFLPNATLRYYYRGVLVDLPQYSPLGGPITITPTSFTEEVRFRYLAGPWEVEVINPDGGHSNRFPFTVATSLTGPFTPFINPFQPSLSTTSITAFGYGLTGQLIVKIYKDGALVASIPDSQIQRLTELSIRIPTSFATAGSYQLEVTADGVVGYRLNFTVLATDPTNPAIRDGTVDPITVPFNPQSVGRFTVTGTGLIGGPRNLVIAGSDGSVYTSRSNVFPELVAIQEWTDTRIVFDLKTLRQIPGIYTVSLEQSTIPNYRGWSFVVAPPPR
jgi:uncharacterized protein (TIGR03437 family)